MANSSRYRRLAVVGLCLQGLYFASAADSSPSTAQGAHGGYVAGNFGIAAQISEVKGPETWIKVNPPELGTWLQSLAHGELWIRESGYRGRELPLRLVVLSRVFPEYRAIFSAGSHIRVAINLFAPLGLDSREGFIPGLILRTVVTSNTKWNGIIGYTLTRSDAQPGRDENQTPWPALEEIHTRRIIGGKRGRVFLAVNSEAATTVAVNGESDRLVVSFPIQLEAGSSKRATLAAGVFDPLGRYTHETPDASKLASDLVTRSAMFRNHLHQFIDAMPRTGDAKLDEYLHWYAAAGILLTKGDRYGHVVTMGYRELNQRDSFWTSGVHLVFWPELEQAMLLESARGQNPSGRVPTTLLPEIDRGDEIDSSEYFVLRAARYYRWYRDDSVLKQLWPAIRKAMDYLASRDSENVGVPMQLSYWADWKDVPGEQGRKYAPHFALLWLAALRSASELAVEMKEPETAAHYARLAEKAAEFINQPFSSGGLWNGRNYVERWEDGILRDYVLEDQVVGAYFNVIPEERLQLIYQALRSNGTTWGVREKFPYQADWTAAAGGTGGNSHNGGIWPYLNFVDAAGRYKHGHAAEAEQIIHAVGAADLDAQDDDQPGEYLNGDRGDNEGFPVQGWDAVLFSALYSGAFGIERISRSMIEVNVHIPPPRDFATQLILPGCKGILSRKAGRLTWSDAGSCRRLGITVAVSGDG